MLGRFEPIPDEAFSSWVYRQSIFDKHTCYPLHEVVECFTRSSQAGFGDIDFDSKDSFVLESCERLDLSCAELWYLIAERGEWRIPKFYRRSFCYECFCQQIDQYAYPSILKRWSLVYYTVCEIHGSPMLDSSNDYGYRLDGAIKLFKYYHSQKKRIEASLLHSFQDRERILELASRVQVYLSKVEVSARDPNDRYATALWMFCKLTLRIFLHARYGIIYQFSGRPHYSDIHKPFRYRLHMGAATASVIQRRAAMILLSQIVSVCPSSELEGVETYLSNSPISRLRLNSVWDLGRHSNVFASTQSEVLVMQLSRCAEILNIPSITNFVDGFCQARK